MLSAWLPLLLLLTLIATIATATNNDGTRRRSLRLKLKREALFGRTDIPRLPAELMEKIFSFLPTTRNQPDPESKEYLPQVRLINQESRSIIKSQYFLWQYKIFFACYNTPSLFKAAKRLFDSNTLLLRNVNYGSPCFQAIQSTLEPHHYGLRSYSQTKAKIRDLLWEDRVPTRNQSRAFVWILERVYRDLDALTIDAELILDPALFNDDTIVEEEAGELPQGQDLLRELQSRFWRAMLNLSPHYFTAFTCNINGLYRAYKGNNNSGLFRVIRRLRNLRILQLWEPEDEEVVLQGVPWITLLAEAIHDKRKLYQLEIRWSSPVQDAAQLIWPFNVGLPRMKYLTVTGGGAKHFIHEFAPLLSQLTALIDLRLDDPTWTGPLPRFLIQAIIRHLPLLDTAVLPPMHVDDVFEWRSALRYGHYDGGGGNGYDMNGGGITRQKQQFRFACRDDGSMQEYRRVWSVGFEEAHCLESPIVETVAWPASNELHSSAGMHFYSDKLLICASKPLDEFLPDRESFEFQQLQRVVAYHQSVRSAVGIIRRLQYLPSLSSLKLFVRPVASDEQQHDWWQPGTLKELVNQPRLKALNLRIFSALVTPRELLSLLEDLVDDVSGAKPARALESLELFLADNPIWSTAHYFDHGSVSDLLGLSRQLLQSRLEQTRNLQNVRIKLGDRMLINWQRSPHQG